MSPYGGIVHGMADSEAAINRVPLNNAGDFGAYIRWARERAGLTQADLAKQVKVSRKWLSEVENGKPTAEIGLILAALRQLGVVVHAGQVPEPSVDVDALLDALTRK